MRSAPRLLAQHRVREKRTPQVVKWLHPAGATEAIVVTAYTSQLSCREDVAA